MAVSRRDHEFELGFLISFFSLFVLLRLARLAWPGWLGDWGLAALGAPAFVSGQAAFAFQVGGEQTFAPPTAGACLACGEVPGASAFAAAADATARCTAHGSGRLLGGLRCARVPDVPHAHQTGMFIYCVGLIGGNFIGSGERLDLGTF